MKTKKKIKYPKDQEKYNHHEELKGHKTHKHHVAALREQEAMEQIRHIPPCVRNAYQDEQ